MENFNVESEPTEPVLSSTGQKLEDKSFLAREPCVRRPYVWIVVWTTGLLIVAFSVWYFMTREKPITLEEREASMNTLEEDKPENIEPERREDFLNQSSEVRVENISDERKKSFESQNNETRI
ncbi:MAG: hypothetical protein HZA95_01015 [Candidatus Vogelbacteria bacterium]|nr:hypothetical protein [Candidatus Vogelbacteria bacterium]